MAVRRYAVASGACGHMRSRLLYVTPSSLFRGRRAAVQGSDRVLMSFSSLRVMQIILGSTVTRAPNVTMAPSALTDLELALDLFEHGAQISLRARQALVCYIFRALLPSASRIHRSVSSMCHYAT